MQWTEAVGIDLSKINSVFFWLNRCVWRRTWRRRQALPYPRLFSSPVGDCQGRWPFVHQTCGFDDEALFQTR